jgi:orotate phosphoribosyltransferase
VKHVEEILTKTKALLDGHFILTSGRHAGRYMQCAKILQYPEYTEQIAEFLAGEFANDEIDIVISPAVGAIVLGYELARKLKAVAIFAERQEGRMVLRRGFEIPEKSKVLVVEDVVTTGGSVLEVIELVKASGAWLAGVALLVDRSGGAVNFGVKTAAAYTTSIESYVADDCPLCREGKIPAVKPGSRAVN